MPSRERSLFNSLTAFILMTSFSFSQNLIEKAIKVFHDEDGLDISAETANEYLEDLSGLFLAFADHDKPRPAQ